MQRGGFFKMSLKYETFKILTWHFEARYDPLQRASTQITSTVTWGWKPEALQVKSNVKKHFSYFLTLPRIFKLCPQLKIILDARLLFFKFYVCMSDMLSCWSRCNPQSHRRDSHLVVLAKRLTNPCAQVSLFWNRHGRSNLRSHSLPFKHLNWLFSVLDCLIVKRYVTYRIWLHDLCTISCLHFENFSAKQWMQIFLHTLI